MPLVIRPEEPRDYRRVAEIHALAFAGNGEPFPCESILVDMLRHGEGYDPELSLVAVDGGIVVGHALFCTYELRLGGEKVRAANLAPIGVHPEYQGRGVGGLLIEEGHSRAAERGCALSFLLGHDTYYPRFRYRTGMFGLCRLKMQRVELTASGRPISERLPSPDDLPILQKMWEAWYGDVDLAVFPGASLLGWLSHAKSARATVVTAGEEVLGYIRYTVEKPWELLCFLARDAAAAAEILAHVAAKEWQGVALDLHLHPDARAAQLLPGQPHEAEVTPWSAGMIAVLDPGNRAVKNYVEEVSAGKRRPGLVTWPVCFDVC